MRLFAAIFSLFALAACGLAEDERDDQNKYVYLTFPDEAFEAFCLEHYDLNRDRRISRYEAQRVLSMDCSGCGIEVLSCVEEFSRLEKLVCSGNRLAQLDVRKCTRLVQIDCGANSLVSIDVGGLRGLTKLICPGNNLTSLDLRAAASLRELDCTSNDIGPTLDLTACQSTLRAFVRENPRLATVYARSAQAIYADGNVNIIRQ